VQIFGNNFADQTARFTGEFDEFFAVHLTGTMRFLQQN